MSRASELLDKLNSMEERLELPGIVIEIADLFTKVVKDDRKEFEKVLQKILKLKGKLTSDLVKKAVANLDIKVARKLLQDLNIDFEFAS